MLIGKHAPTISAFTGYVAYLTAYVAIVFATRKRALANGTRQVSQLYMIKASTLLIPIGGALCILLLSLTAFARLHDPAAIQTSAAKNALAYKITEGSPYPQKFHVTALGRADISGIIASNNLAMPVEE